MNSLSFLLSVRLLFVRIARSLSWCRSVAISACVFLRLHFVNQFAIHLTIHWIWKAKRTFALRTHTHLIIWRGFFFGLLICVFIPLNQKYQRQQQQQNLHFHLTHYILNTGFLCVFLLASLRFLNKLYNYLRSLFSAICLFYSSEVRYFWAAICKCAVFWSRSNQVAVHERVDVDLLQKMKRRKKTSENKCQTENAKCRKRP